MIEKIVNSILLIIITFLSLFLTAYIVDVDSVVKTITKEFDKL